MGNWLERILNALRARFGTLLPRAVPTLSARADYQGDYQYGADKASRFSLTVTLSEAVAGQALRIAVVSAVAGASPPVIYQEYDSPSQAVQAGKTTYGYKLDVGAGAVRFNVSLVCGSGTVIRSLSVEAGI